MARVVLALFVVAVGVLHFARPEGFVRIVPAALPFPLALVYLSGFFEIALGLGLLWPRSRRVAAWGLVALFVAVFPANVNMAVNHIQPEGATLPEWAFWARLPLQIALVAWAVWVGKRQAAVVRSPA
ncbi:MAG: DoxX family membrane protein [Myxococcales bacterium]|nr:DoxX family membrane protein [Myxococcales bacterium]